MLAAKIEKLFSASLEMESWKLGSSLRGCWHQQRAYLALDRPAAYFRVVNRIPFLGEVFIY